MSILPRYILREVISHAVLGGVLFTFVLFIRDLGKILELVVRNSASWWDVLRIFLYTLPNALTVTIPMAVLVGILLGLSRLAADSEITAMRACGMGAWQFVRIVGVVAVAALGLGLVNSVYLAPRAAGGLLRLEGSLKSSQASFEVEPRVFYEDFKNYVLYVQDVRAAQGAAVWHHVFLADLSVPATPHITTADQALVVNGNDGTLRMHLMDGGQHQIAASDPNQYEVSTFATMNLPILTGAQEDTHVSRSDTPLHALTLAELWRRARGAGGRAYAIELQTRFSYPFACLVLMLVGVPLGLSSKRGGKSTGFVVTILLVFLYYFLSSVGVALAKSGKLGPVLGVWGANLLFGLAGALLLQQLSQGGAALNLAASAGQWVNARATQWLRRREPAGRTEEREPFDLAVFLRRTFRLRFPLLLDDYVMKEYGKNFGLVLLAMLMLFLVFTFFELIGDMIRNKTPLVVVGDYLLNLVPFVLSQVTPLCSLVAVLITFGALNRSSEITAMKSSGISIYRVVAPVLVLAAMLAGALFAFDELYLPAANRRQEAIRSVIKGRPAQTFLRPDRKWISGQTGEGGPTRIFYYQFFDPDKNQFANLTVFEFDPATFALTRRIFAGSARWDEQVNRWVFENGWQRTFAAETTATYQGFTLASFPEIREVPAYFKKEDLQSQEMSYGQLSRYIDDLRQSGFDTKRLNVQLDRKIAYPLITLIMAVLAVPFALMMGRRGGLAGIATAIGMAIAYWVVDGVFGAMGNVNTLPAMLAAWSPDVLFLMAGSYLLLRVRT